MPAEPRFILLRHPTLHLVGSHDIHSPAAVLRQRLHELFYHTCSCWQVTGGDGHATRVPMSVTPTLTYLLTYLDAVLFAVRRTHRCCHMYKSQQSAAELSCGCSPFFLSAVCVCCNTKSILILLVVCVHLVICSEREPFYRCQYIELQKTAYRHGSTLLGGTAKYTLWHLSPACNAD